MEPLFAVGASAVPCLAFAAFGAVAAVVIVLGILHARRQREAMAALAAELGLQFYADDPWGLPERYAHFALMGRGHSRRASNVLAGTVGGRRCVAFNYRYTTGSGKNRTTHSYQAAVLDLPILADHLWLRQESVFDTIASWVGRDDLDFESDEFSRRYYVKCERPKFAYDIFHTRLIEYLLGCGTAPSIEMNGPLIMVYEKPNGAEGVRRLIATAQQVVQSIPEYVLTERGIAQPPGANG